MLKLCYAQKEVKMRKFGKKLCCFIFILAFMGGILPQTAVEAKAQLSCKVLCSAALKATGGSKKLKYASTSAIDFGGLSASARDKVKNIQYICDAKEVYSLCVIETGNAASAKAVLKALKKYKKSNCSSNYLSDYSSVEKKVFKNAVCGRQGKFVWYIAMSPKKEKNNRGQTAIKKKM